MEIKEWFGMRDTNEQIKNLLVSIKDLRKEI